MTHRDTDIEAIVAELQPAQGRTWKHLLATLAEGETK